MLAFLSDGRPAKGFDAVVGVLLRLVGVAGLGFTLLVAMAIFVAATAGDVDGWGGLIIVLAIMLGLGSAILAAWFIAGAHFAFRAWREQRPRPVRWMGASLALVGATFWAPYAFQDYHAPLDLYLAELRFAMLLVGATIWVGARHW